MNKIVSQTHSFSSQARKKGTHIGFVISFVMFVTFFLFLYSFLIGPKIVSDGKKNILDDVKKKLVEDLYSEEFTTMTIIITPATGGGNQECIKLTGGDAKPILEQTDIINILKIKDSEDNIIGYSIQGGQILIGEIDNRYEGILKVYYGSLVSRSPEYGGNPNCKNVNADTGLIKSDSQIFESRIIELIERYESDYEGLKEELGIPLGTEFTFSFERSDGVVLSPSSEEPIAVNIYSTEIPVQYVSDDATILFGKLTIKVW
ncbi:hypothetical protein J4407_02370 [Candidatus Pacearchaeota archaeon]|nr:hypothetical protein [Candidatus Pacearchaeota archaeon]